MSAIIKIDIASSIIAAYNEAQTTLSHWGVGGDYSRALSVITNIVVGSPAGEGTTQLASNAVAPYAAEMIGNTFAHTDNPNEAAQLLSHAVLGGVLAYVNGGNAASGAIAGAGAEAAALSIAKELYPNAFVNGVLDRSKLSETQANAILALSSAVGAFVGGISGGGLNNAVIDANVAQNAVENNRFSWSHALSLANENYTTTMDALSFGPANIGTIAANREVLKTANAPYASNMFSSKTPYMSLKDWAFSGFKTTSMGVVDTALFRVIEPAAIGTGAFQLGVGTGSLGVGVIKEYIEGEK